jgi:NAD(P)-dependent dehydrogenase (short-subunit alcohol dehydrogenase family)
MKIDFEGQVVLITGATRGIGKQIADDFAELGAKLILTGTHEDQIKALNRSNRKHGNVRKIYYCVDFTSVGGTQKFLAKLREYDRIDVCVNNAGINRIEYVDKTKVEDWDDILSVNLRAPFLIIREVSKIMKKNGYGRIINISSIFGIISREKRTIYSASKFGLRGLTIASSNELARHNILVNTVSPGFVLTELTKIILSEQEMAELVAQVPARRFATPDEISKAVLFLASSFNTYITGQNIIVDGGYVNV